jgi:DNA invertase Pin-like site-specific DNA recombinase
LIDNFLKDRSDIVAVSEYVDANYSGVTFDRPGLNELFSKVICGEINCLIVKDLSRLGRSFIEVGILLRDFFPQYGVRFISINDNIDTYVAAAHGDMLVSLKNIINEQYSYDISKKTRAALTVRREHGDYVGASPCYGYVRSDDNRHRLVPDEYAAEIVKSIFAMKVQGKSAAKIAAYLNGKGVSSPRIYKNRSSATRQIEKSTWSAGTVLRILKDKTYTGALIQGRQSVYSFPIKQTITHPENEWITTIEAHAPIISLNEFEQVQRLLQLDTRNRILRSFPRDSTKFVLIIKKYLRDCTVDTRKKVSKLARKSRKQSQSGRPVTVSTPFIVTAGYVRLSVEDRDNKGSSIHGQKQIIQEYVERHTMLHLIKIFVDDGESGLTYERPAFKEMLEAAEQGKIKCIIVKDISRLGRNLIDTGVLFRKIISFIRNQTYLRHRRL